MTTTWGYSRTSTDAQGGEGGLHLLSQAGIPDENVFFDRGVSGMLASRPALDKLLSVVQSGDTIYTPTLSRLGRSTARVLDLVEDLEKRGVGLVVMDLGIDTTTSVGRLTITVLSAVNRMTRDLTAEATRDALAARKAAGVQLGRPPKVSAEKDAGMVKMKEAGLSAEEIGAVVGLSRAQVFARLAKLKQAS